MTDEIFTIPETPPSPLTAARSRLAKAALEMKRCEELHDQQGPEAEPAMNIADREYLNARRAVETLETAALKSL